MKWESFLHHEAHILSLLPPGWIGIKTREFNFAAKSRVLTEGPKGRKALQGLRATEAPTPARCRPAGRMKAKGPHRGRQAPPEAVKDLGRGGQGRAAIAGRGLQD